MAVKRVVVAALMSIAAAAVPLVAHQQPTIPPGSRIFVVALRDSRFLTLCPVRTKDFATDWTLLPNDVKGGANQHPPNSELVVIVAPAWLRNPAATHGEANLPLPAAVPPPNAVAAPASAATQQLDRLAFDPTVRTRVEDGFRKIGRYVLVDSLEQADYVFLVESNYTVFGAASVTPPGGGGTSEGGGPVAFRGAGQVIYSSMGGGDRPPNWRESVLAVAVPADVYRRSAGDASALTAARIWEGFALWERVGPRGQEKWVAASPDTLVDEFNGRWHEPLKALPVCAAAGAAALSGTRTGDMQPNAPAASRASGSSGTPAPRPDAMFRARVTLVSVPLTVVDDAGRTILDAKPSELHLFEDAVEQHIDRVLPMTSSSSIALLLDTSGSMFPQRAHTHSAALSLIDLLRPEDRLLLSAFDNRIRLLAEFSGSPDALKRSVPGDFGWGAGMGTRLYDAIDLIVEERLNHVEGRAAMVLVTDGIDTRSRLTDAFGAMATVDNANVAVYVVRYDTMGTTTFRLPNAVAGAKGRAFLLPDNAVDTAQMRSAADQYLFLLSTRSGGRMYTASSGSDLHEVFADIVKNLSQQYTIWYYPSNDRSDGEYRQIRVTIDRPGATVRARQGYRAGTPDPHETLK